MADTASCRQRWHSNQDDEASCWYGRHVTVREDTQLPSWVVTRGLGDESSIPSLERQVALDKSCSVLLAYIQY